MKTTFMNKGKKFDQYEVMSWMKLIKKKKTGKLYLKQKSLKMISCTNHKELKTKFILLTQISRLATNQFISHLLLQKMTTKYT